MAVRSAAACVILACATGCSSIGIGQTDVVALHASTETFYRAVQEAAEQSSPPWTWSRKGKDVQLDRRDPPINRHVTVEPHVGSEEPGYTNFRVFAIYVDSSGTTSDESLRQLARQEGAALLKTIASRATSASQAEAAAAPPVATPPAPSHESAPRGRGRLLITSAPAGAKISLDGELVGTTFEGKPADIPVRAERVRVRIAKEGYETWEESFRVLEGAVIDVHAVLKQRSGEK